MILSDFGYEILEGNHEIAQIVKIHFSCKYEVYKQLFFAAEQFQIMYQLSCIYLVMTQQFNKTN